jgi:hypothetical protein
MPQHHQRPDRSVSQYVPHVSHNHLMDGYLVENGQPYASLCGGVFVEEAKEVIMPKIQKGIFPALFPMLRLARTLPRKAYR